MAMILTGDGDEQSVDLSTSQQDPQRPAPQPLGQDPPGEEPGVIQQIVRRQRAQADQMLVESFNVASKGNPAAARKAAQLGGQVGIDQGTAERNPDDIRAMAAQLEFEQAQLEKLSPSLAQKMRDPLFAAQAVDDWKNLSTYERTLAGGETAALNIERGRIGLRMQVNAWAGTSTSPEDFRRIAEIDALLKKLPPTSGILPRTAEVLRYMRDPIAAGTAVAVIAGSASAVFPPAEILTVPTAFAIGALTAGIPMAAAVGGGNFYIDMLRRQGVNPSDAWFVSVGLGAVSSAAETAGVGFLAVPFKRMIGKAVGEAINEALVRPTITKAAGRSALTYIKAQAGEGSTEMAQTVAEIMAEGSLTGEWENVGKKLADTAIGSAEAMALIALPGAAMQFAHESRQVRQAKESAAKHQAKKDSIVASKLRADHPAAFEQFAQDANAGTATETVYVDAVQFDAMLRQGGKGESETQGQPLYDDLDKLLPGFSAKVREAAARGDDIAMPSATFDARLVGTPLGDALEPHIRYDVDDKSQFEAEQAVELAKEFETKVDDQAEKIETTAQELSDIRKELVAQAVATGRMDKSAAALDAEHWSAFVATQSERLQMTPAEFQKLAPLSIRGGEVRGEALAQGGADTPEFRAWFGESKVIDAGGKPLVVYHGSPSRFEEFAKERAGSRTDKGYLGRGFYFGSKEHAALYANLGTDKDRIAFATSDDNAGGAYFPVGSRSALFPVFLSLRNPLVLTERTNPEGEYANVPGEVNARQSQDRELHIRQELGLPRGATAEQVTAKAKALGFDGVVFDYGSKGGLLDREYVAFDPTQIKSTNNLGTFDPNDPNILRAKDGKTVRGAIDPTTLAITLTPDSTFDTLSHELGHAFLLTYAKLAMQKAHPTIVDDFNAFLSWAGVESLEKWNAMSLEQQRPHHEAFVEQHQAWMLEGKAPTPKLQRLFDRFLALFRAFGRAILGRNAAAYKEEFGVDLPPLTDELRAVMSRMVASEDAVRTTQAIRGAVPAFQTKEESGMTTEQFTAYQEQRVAADDEAVATLTKESLRAMRWLSNAKGKALRELQGKEKAARTKMQSEVGAAIQAQPVYRALRWLRRGEFEAASDGKWHKDPTKHKLNRDAVRSLLGLGSLEESELVAQPAAPPPKPTKFRRGKSMLTRAKELGGISPESWKTYPGEKRGEFKIPFLVRRGGMPWDYLAKALAAEGYAPFGGTAEDATAEEGSGNTMWFVEALRDAASGHHTYSKTEQATLTEADEPRTRAPESDEERALRASSEEEAKQERAAIMMEGASVQTRSPARALDRLRGVLAEDGLEPDLVADLFGLKSGAQLVDAILTAPDIGDAIEAAIDARMLAEHSDLADPKKRDAIIEATLHTEARRRFVAAELRALTKSMEPERVTLGAAKEAARVALETRKVNELSPRTFTLAARRASVEAQKAVAAGDTMLAIQWKRRQLVQEQMADLAAEARDQVTKTVRFFRQFNDSDKNISKTRDIDLAYAAQALAAAYKLGPMVSGQQRVGLAEAGLKAVQTEHAGIGERLRPLLDAARRGPIDYRTLTVAELREVSEMGEQLWGAAKAENEFEVAGKKLVRAEVHAKIAAQLAKAPPAPSTSRAIDGETPTPLRKAIMSGWSAVASTKKWEQAARTMDGQQDGPLQRFLLDPLMRQVAVYRTARTEIIRDLGGVHDAAKARHGSNWTARFVAAELAAGNRVFRGVQEILGFLLHLGTESNAQADLVARGWADWTTDEAGNRMLDMSRVNAFVDGLVRDKILDPKQDGDFLEHWWGVFRKLLPEAQKAHKARFKHEFKTIEDQPVTLGDRVLRGGYVPKRASRYEADPRMFRQRDVYTASANSFQYSVGTKRGFTLDRDENYRPPLTHNVAELIANADEELRFIHMEQPVAEIEKLLRSRIETVGPDGEVSRGPSLEDQLNAYDRNLVSEVVRPWLQNTAQQISSIPSQSGLWRLMDAGVSLFRNAATVARLGLNVENSLVQSGGALNARNEVSGKTWRAAVRLVSLNPRQSFRTMTEKSPLMAQEYDSETRRIEDRLRRAAHGPAAGKVIGFRQGAAEFGRIPQMFFQSYANMVAWHSGYMEATEQGKSEEDAVARGDQVFRLTQGNANPENRSASQVTTKTAGALTQFGTYSATVLANLMGARGLPRAARAWVWVLLLPALYEHAIKSMVRGVDDEDDDDSKIDDFITGYAKNVARNITNLVPIVGPMASSLAYSEGVRVQESPASGVFLDIIRGVAEIAESAGGDETTEREAYLQAVALSFITGIPLAAPVRTRQQVAR